MKNHLDSTNNTYKNSAHKYSIQNNQTMLPYIVSSDSLNDNDFAEDTLIQFKDEEDEEEATTLVPWKILIADDDANVHDTTVLALSGVLIHGRPLEFFHAYSAQGARTLVDNHPDAAILLLDVVMESADAGLKLIPILRNELGRQNLRIIMRTGQPGYAKERIMEDYHIDGYTSKSQLTRKTLIQIITDTLSSKKDMN